MRCPYCRHPDSRVTDSREQDERPGHPPPPLLPGVRPPVHHARGGDRSRSSSAAASPSRSAGRRWSAACGGPARAARSTRTRWRSSRRPSRRRSGPPARPRCRATRSGWPSSARCARWTRSPTCASRASTRRSARSRTSRRRSSTCAPSTADDFSTTTRYRRATQSEEGPPHMTEAETRAQAPQATRAELPEEGPAARARVHDGRACTRTARSTWERRDVVMTNWRDGSINFEQRGVEFPDFWSVNAANIVTTKYFRGAVGTDVRASGRCASSSTASWLHLPARPASATATSRSAADAEIFEHELTWMLLHQVFSFNSPVWFNVGTASPQQVLGLLHPGRRRHDGLDPELVPRRGADLQGRLRAPG